MNSMQLMLFMCFEYFSDKQTESTYTDESKHLERFAFGLNSNEEVEAF